MLTGEWSRGRRGTKWGESRGGHQRSRNDKTQSESRFDRYKIDAVQAAICSRLGEALKLLGVNCRETPRKFVGVCPIHGGDNTHAFNLYKDGHSMPGAWKCYTHNCHLTFHSSLIGCIRGILSHNEKGWESPSDSDRMVSFQRAINWCYRFLEQDPGTFSVDWAEMEKKKYISIVNTFSYSPAEKQGGLTREQVRARLKPPSQYFIDRGWSKEVLDKFDVGDCEEKGRFFSERAVVPVYDNAKKFAVGFTARSISGKQPKWLNSKGFSKEYHLYNYWGAKDHIEETQVVCLCEGPGDLWRLEEAGIQNGVAMFGVSLSDPQQVILEMSGALDIVILTNMDEPGRQAAQHIKKQLERSFRVFIPSLPTNDLGDMSPQQVRESLQGIVT